MIVILLWEVLFMDTCLDSLWELIRNQISQMFNNIDENKIEIADNLSKNYSIAEDCKEIIDDFFINIKKTDYLSESKCIEMPKHLVKFRDLLDNFSEISIKGLSEGIVEAINLAGSCNLCSICRNCASDFYDEINKRNIIEKSIPHYLENYFSNRPQMSYYNSILNDEREKVNLNDTLFCLKGFSSSTPTIHSIAFNSSCAGGGLYLNYKGLGIAIDPGIGFVDSMHKYGIYINNINVIIITHDHLDHNADAEMLCSLLYDYNEYMKRRNSIIKNIFNFNGIQEHHIIWIVDENSKKKLKGKAREIKDLNKYIGHKSGIIKHNLDMKLTAIRTKHIKDNNSTYGIKLFLSYEKKFIIGYTSDTMYFEELSKFYNESNILIFNVSDIYKKDVKGVKDKHSHLGYNGSLKLLQNTSSDLALASEFCCTNGDFRMNFINTLNSELKGTYLIPGEIGLKIYIPNLSVECSICRNKSPLKDITVLAPQSDYGKIKYICRHCLKRML